MSSAISFSIPVIFVLGIIIARLIELKAKRDTIAGPVRENLSFRLFFAVGLLMLFSSLTEYIAFGKSFSSLFFLLGLIAAWISFSLRMKAIRALGEFWSLHVEIREDHQMVRTGPFRWVRHPTYLSMIFELLAIALTLQAFYSLIIIPLLYIPSLLYRLHLEEAALVSKFGESYRQYQKDVPMLFPTKLPNR